jgi:DNA-binding CsgD family transcriptional regulator
MARGNIASLTETQKRCLRFVTKDCSSKDIARTLNISPHTVDTHIRTAVKLLGATSRFDAARILHSHETQSKRALSSQPSRLPEPEKSAIQTVSQQMLELAETGRPKRTKLLPLPDYWGDRHDLTNTAKLGWIALLAIYICVSLGALVALFDTLNRFYKP